MTSMDTGSGAAVAVTVNGQPHQMRVEPRKLLADFLREELGLTGTHIGCEEGICGACTVRVDGQLVKSCMMLTVEAHDCEVETVEGLSGEQSMHPVQEAFCAEFALQCGFCTPGMVMAAVDLLERHPDPDEETVRQGLVGNLCRCTGYQNIVRAVQRAADGSQGRTEGQQA
ncbi:(2Fe-2S)-binding protein [Egibacter rhizosphaerae]|uniref:(2Fe-2S)-binding protein n=1 Tax=Egibacter rhizosphaerae TaxID=1670831 RepID=A0A411YB91_9ACTN|nr:(2Fe-2S)-binding protein [Egibacter rhizosphaerae]QBI18523.1 (2Fe-2S)-binding protein [Egibacter rhizosphaerae]